MLITDVRAYQQDQPFVAGPYTCRGQTEIGFQSVIVSITAENGVTGWGEAAPLGAFYAEAFPEEIAAGVARLLPGLIGQRADDPVLLAQIMDVAMLGQPGVKSAIDMAAWDLAARLAGRPLARLLGGGGLTRVPLYRSVSQASPDEMAEKAKGFFQQGYRRLQVKVGVIRWKMWNGCGRCVCRFLPMWFCMRMPMARGDRATPFVLPRSSPIWITGWNSRACRLTRA